MVAALRGKVGENDFSSCTDAFGVPLHQVPQLQVVNVSLEGLGGPAAVILGKLGCQGGDLGEIDPISAFAKVKEKAPLPIGFVTLLARE